MSEELWYAIVAGAWLLGFLHGGMWEMERRKIKAEKETKLNE